MIRDYDTRYIPAMRLLRSFEDRIYTVDIDSRVHRAILSSHPVDQWKYSDWDGYPQYFGHVRVDILRPLYIRLCLEYS